MVTLYFERSEKAPLCTHHSHPSSCLGAHLPAKLRFAFRIFRLTSSLICATLTCVRCEANRDVPPRIGVFRGRLGVASKRFEHDRIAGDLS